MGNQAVDRLLQQVLARTAPHLHLGRKRHGELDELVIEERHSGLDGGRHRHLVDPHQEELGEALLQLQVGHLLEEVGVGPLPLGLLPEALNDPI